MRQVLRRHLFLLIGLMTWALFFLVAALGGESSFAQTAARLMRLLIVPMYLVWLLVTMILVAIFGPGGPPAPLGPVVFVFDFFAGFAPYVLADYALARWRKGRRSSEPRP
jgi:hypothetical protein